MTSGGAGDQAAGVWSVGRGADRSSHRESGEPLESAVGRGAGWTDPPGRSAESAGGRAIGPGSLSAEPPVGRATEVEPSAEGSVG